MTFYSHHQLDILGSLIIFLHQFTKWVPINQCKPISLKGGWLIDTRSNKSKLNCFHSTTRNLDDSCRELKFNTRVLCKAKTRQGRSTWVGNINICLISQHRTIFIMLVCFFPKASNNSLACKAELTDQYNINRVILTGFQHRTNALCIQPQRHWDNLSPWSAAATVWNIHGCLSSEPTCFAPGMAPDLLAKFQKSYHKDGRNRRVCCLSFSSNELLSLLARVNP